MSWVIRHSGAADAIRISAVAHSGMFSAGCVEADLAPDGRYWISRVFVQPDWRGKGLGASWWLTLPDALTTWTQPPTCVQTPTMPRPIWIDWSVSTRPTVSCGR
jgi:GNAT superfamily N-acetyltransferase